MALLIPLIIVAGVLAFIGAIAVRVTGRMRPRVHRPQPAAAPAVVHFDAAAAEATLGGAA